MAIFVALIFQVLFVFFAMAINIGLVVHDKINLQNAVDLAAYYAAQRQAEWLNVMAHQNYQIRQSYKLLTWRYRVLGTMGVSEGGSGIPQHPIYSNAAGPDATNMLLDFPVACYAYSTNFKDVSGSDSLCKRPFDPDPNAMQTIVNTIQVRPVVFPAPWNFNVRDLVKETNLQILSQCQSYGGYNYLISNLFKLSYLVDQWKLKRVMLTEAANLSKPIQEMLDIRGDSVYQGVVNTLRKNLTYQNQLTLDSDNIQVLNGIGGRAPTEWLNELNVNLTMLYTDVSANSSGCRAVPKQVHIQPERTDGIDALEVITGFTKEELITIFEDPPASDLRRLSLGFEKNPWFKIYVGVKAKTAPRQLFFPFGEPVQFEATAYATPFGGRMGPWYKSTWPRGAQSSDGEKVDPRLVPLVSESSGSLSNLDSKLLLPNYSRYPGDNLGMTSALAQTALRGLQGFETTMGEFRESVEINPGFIPDPLSWNGSMQNSLLRKFEIAAVAPDLFDITYYSIEPNYGQVYLPLLRQNAEAFGFPQDALPRPDLGARDGDDVLGQFSVQDQMGFAGANSRPLTGGMASANLHRPEAYYFIKDRAHLLTSWTHSDLFADFQDFPERRFMRCGEFDDEFEEKIPGSCVYDGGRTGYSVKIISGSTLRSDQLRYGGAGQTGALMNPPPDNW